MQATEALIFTCSICGEASKDLCAYCTKDACRNHRCDRCKRCSDCCECDVPLSAVEPSSLDAALPETAPAEVEAPLAVEQQPAETAEYAMDGHSYSNVFAPEPEQPAQSTTSPLFREESGESSLMPLPPEASETPDQNTPPGYAVENLMGILWAEEKPKNQPLPPWMKEQQEEAAKPDNQESDHERGEDKE